MDRQAVLITGRPVIGEWVGAAFRRMRGWRLDVISHSQLALKAVSDDVDAAIIDIGCDATDVVPLCEAALRQCQNLRLVAISCCDRDSDERMLTLMRLGVSGYLVCDGSSLQFARTLSRTLDGAPTWPMERLARIILQSDDAPESLSEPDLQLIRLSARGLRYKEIGLCVGLSRHTVRHRLEALRRRTRTSTTAELVVWAAERGLLAEEPKVGPPLAVNHAN